MVCRRSFARLVVSVLVATVVFISGCATNPQTGQLEVAPSVQTGFNSIFNNQDPCSNNDLNIGMVTGAVIGGAVGYVNKGAKGAVLGVLAGGATGGLIGHVLDNRRCELYKIAQANHLQLTSAQITPEKIGTQSSAGGSGSDTIGLDVQIKNKQDEFEPGTARLTPQAREYIGEIAKQYAPAANQPAQQAVKTPQNEFTDRKVLIVAHTDEGMESGKEASRLTEDRARAVAKVFHEAGVPEQNIYYQGAGSALPVAANNTSAGRADNQRLQIVDVPNENDLKQYLQQRSVNDSYLAPATAVPVATQRRSEGSYNFGGGPLADQKVSIDLGAPINRSMFNVQVISTTSASESVVVPSCMADKPRSVSAVVNLASGRSLPIRDYMPGFYGAPWLGGFNGNLIVIDHAFVPRDAGSPTPDPEVKIYRSFKGDAKAHPSFVRRVPVNVYRGEQATLYRMFVDGPADCIDFVKPNTAGNSQGKVYYEHDGQRYLADGAFAMKGQ
jgi:outer membrane protein OmpA-like peptidoglycan-associated protein